MPTYRLDIEYDGTRYSGWQEQRNARTVAGELRRCLVQAGAVVRELAGSGRTDAGVHALRQTAHLRLRNTCAGDRLAMDVNQRLPSDLNVLGIWRAGEHFHARHDAVARAYVYQLARRRTALAKRWVWWIQRPLDERMLGAAAASIVGRHDFRLLCERSADQTGTVVVVEQAELREHGELILVRLVASHFLWKMVRRIVGALVRVGTGAMAMEEFVALLDPRTPRPLPGEEGIARWTAPPSGLFLERVVYPGERMPGPLVPAIPVPRADAEGVGTVFLGSEGRRRGR